MSAANKTSLLIDGDANLHLTINDHEVTANVSVLPAISELLQNKCHPDFAASTIYIGNRQVHAYQCEQVGAHCWPRLLCQ